VKIFCLYANEDSDLAKKLNAQLLAYLRHVPIKVEFCYNDTIPIGKNRESEIYLHLNGAHIILLPISANFLNSDDYDWVVTRAMTRYLQENISVIPVYLRPVHWKNAPFSKLPTLPKNGQPVVSWSKLDNALYDVIIGIEEVILSFHDQLSKEPAPAHLLTPVTDVVHTKKTLSPYSVIWKPGEYTFSQTLVSHLGPISSVTLSSDATVLISDSWDKELLYWNVHASKARPVRTLSQLSNPIYTVSFNNNETFVASGGDDWIVRIWHPYTGSLLQTLEGHTGPVSCVAFSPDGKMLASASDDHTIRLWDPFTGSLLQTLEGHTGPVSCVAFSSDGKILVSGSYDTTLKVWDTSQEYQFSTLAGDDADIIRCVAFYLSPARSPRASQKENYWDVKLVSGDQQGNIRIYSTSTRDIKALNQNIDKVENLLPAKWTMEQKLLHPGGPVYSIASDKPSGALMSGGSDKKIRVWDPLEKKVLEEFGGHEKAVTCIAVSMDGNSIISSSLDTTIKVWQKQKGSVSLPAPNSYPSSEVCPVCQKTVDLAYGARISTKTLKIQKKKLIYGWLKMLYLSLERKPAKQDALIVDGDIRILCAHCTYAFPPHKTSEAKKDSFFRKTSAKATLYFSIILISIILVIGLLVVVSKIPTKPGSESIPHYTSPTYTSPTYTSPMYPPIR
jgi:WD40 repeat protein